MIINSFDLFTDDSSTSINTERKYLLPLFKVKQEDNVNWAQS